jgi:tripartite-type tricarboxylate transporter receptor subunit TctC
LFKKLPYEPIKDFTPIGRLGYAPFVLAVKSDFPAKNVQELMAYARKPENKASYAYGNSTGQVAGAAFSSLSRLNASAVPYKSTPQALTDLIGGQVTFLFVDLASSRPHVQSGRMRGIAVASTQRLKVLPDLPTIAEAGVAGYESTTWFGPLAPAKTPREIVTKLNGELNKVLQLPDVGKRFAAEGIEALGGTPDQFGSYIRADMERWARVVREANIRLD